MAVPNPRRHLRQALVIGVRQGMQLIRNAAVLNATGKVLKRQTGRLATSIRATAEESDQGVVGIVGTNVFYGRIWELTGHRAFTLFAKNAKALMLPFMKLGGGGAGYGTKGLSSVAKQFGGIYRKGSVFIFRRSVHIPAVAAKPFLRPAIEERGPTVKIMVQKELARATKEILARDIRA